MLVAYTFTDLQEINAARSVVAGHTTVIAVGHSTGAPGPLGFGVAGAPVYSQVSSTSLSPKTRWRASKGAAPVGRFTRAFSDNATEGWHRSMPVGIEVSANTTATVVATFILGASAIGEARATAATIGAFVLAVNAIAQARTPATATGALTAGVTSVAQARATASTTGTLALRVTSIAQSLAQASAVAAFVLGLSATADSGGAVILPGVVLALLTLRVVPATLTIRPGDAALTVRRGDASLTARPRVDAALRFETDDPV